MNILQMMNFFGNSSFFFLFFSTISYWVQISFHVQKWNLGRISMILANLCLFLLLILRWFESGHFPLSNLYESLMFLSWSLSTFHLILENIEFGTNKLFEKENLFSKQSFWNPTFSKEENANSLKTLQTYSFLGAFTAPTALFINAFATFRLPPEMQQSAPLVPALQSNWLMMHVTVMILSYAALICGSLLSLAFLIVSGRTDSQNKGSEETKFSFSEPFQGKNAAMMNETVPGAISVLNEDVLMISSPLFKDEIEKNVTKIHNENGSSFKKKFAENLDNLSYRILGIGFPLLTIGILSGAVWANEAWGSYWSWDPKETWALATWFVFAIYLHTRLTKGWSGQKPAIIASLGFVIVWICFLGVNLLGEGLHSYGFLKDSFSKI